jgi:hypothetical protein
VKSIIKQILIESGFVIDEKCFNEEKSFQADRIAAGRFDFLTVIDMKNSQLCLENIQEEFENYLNRIVETRQKLIGIEKNLSLLLLIKVDSLDYTPELNSLIFDIEEDPYNFKKYVLTYTSNQEGLVKTMRKKSNEDIIPFLNNIANDAVLFSKFKSQDNSDEFLIYDLISKLFIKIPFLSITNQQQRVNDLMEDILNDFSSEEKFLWDSLMSLKEENEDPNSEDILDCLGVGEVD